MTKPLDPADLDAIIKLVCPHCRGGHEPTQREDTKEWVHNRAPTSPAGGTYTHTICWATGLRNSDYAPRSAP